MLAALLLLVGCGGETQSPTEAPPPSEEAPATESGATTNSAATNSAATTAAPFVEVAAASGLDFIHFNGMSGELYYSEMMGPGAALLDFDNDGDLDVYLVQGRMLNPDKDATEATFPPDESMLPLTDRLYRNDSENGSPSFTDVTEHSGIDGSGYGMGVATGDADNDGHSDLYLTRAGANRLLLGNGDGTFRDVTAAAGVGDEHWSLSATWIDFDLDGWIDLYVTNYVDFTVAGHRQCRMMSGQPDYCGPQVFEAQPDRLWRNLGGDGELRFEDVSEASGIRAEIGAGMGVVSGDFDGDGRPDLYIANDGMANFLWLNRGDGTFENQALVSGTAFNREGQPEAGMGVAAGDFDGDGDEDLLITHIALETHTLYRNDGGGAFEDVTVPSGLGSPSWPSTGFGAAWLDADNDGRLDLMAVNGGVITIPELAAAGDPHPLGMRNQLFLNAGASSDGDTSFEEVAAAGPFATVAVSRGLTVGDLDNDGDADALVTNNAGAVELLLNQVGQDRHWLGLRLLGTDETPRDMLGAEATVDRPGGRDLWRRVRTGGSYLSASDPRLLFGLGDDPEIGPVTVRWPDGASERFEVEIDRYTTLRQGTGQAASDGG